MQQLRPVSLANIPPYRFRDEFRDLFLSGFNPAEKLFICVQQLQNDPAKCLKILEALPKKFAPKELSSETGIPTGPTRLNVQQFLSVPETFTPQQTSEVITLLQSPEFQGLVNHRRFRPLCKSIAGELKRIVGGALLDNRPECSYKDLNFIRAVASTGDVYSTQCTIRSLEDKAIPPARRAEITNIALNNSLDRSVRDLCDEMLGYGSSGASVIALLTPSDIRSGTRYEHVRELIALLGTDGERAIGGNLLAIFREGTVDDLSVYSLGENEQRGQAPLQLSDSKLWPIRTILEEEIKAVGRDATELLKFQNENQDRLRDYFAAVSQLASVLTAWQPDVYKGASQSTSGAHKQLSINATSQQTAEADFARFKGPVERILSELKQFSDRSESGSPVKAFIDKLIEAPLEISKIIEEMGLQRKQYHYGSVNRGPHILHLHQSSPLGAVCLDKPSSGLDILYAEQALRRRLKEIVVLLKNNVSSEEYQRAVRQGLQLTTLGWVDRDSKILSANYQNDVTIGPRLSAARENTSESILGKMFLGDAKDFIIVGLTKQELLVRLIKSRNQIGDKAAAELIGNEDLLNNLIKGGLLRCKDIEVGGKPEKVYFVTEAAILMLARRKF